MQFQSYCLPPTLRRTYVIAKWHKYVSWTCKRFKYREKQKSDIDKKDRSELVYPIVEPAVRGKVQKKVKRTKYMPCFLQGTSQKKNQSLGMIHSFSKPQGVARRYLQIAMRKAPWASAYSRRFINFGQMIALISLLDKWRCHKLVDGTTSGTYIRVMPKLTTD